MSAFTERIGMRKGILVFVLCILLPGCKSDEEREREERTPVHAEPHAAADGAIHLTPEQIGANHIEVTAASEDDVVPSMGALGRIKPRAGAESQVFAPFSGRLLLDRVQAPRLGADVRAGDVLADVEQIFSASERVQFKASSLQFQADIDQARQEIDLRQKEFDRARQLYEGGA